MIADGPDTLQGPALAYGAALGALQRGWAPIPVPFCEKGPVLKGWQNLQITTEKLPDFFDSQPQNLGIRLGDPSHGLIDIDLDCPETIALAPTFLPPTGCIFGRRGKPRSHYLYSVTSAVDTKKFQDTDGSMLVELRSTGCQTVFPPSVHPSGELVRYDEADEPAQIDGSALREAVARVAAAALLVRSWPHRGSRQNAAMALGGALLRSGWTVEETVAFVRVVATAAGDEEIEDRVKTIQGSDKKLDAEKPVTGWPTLAKLVGKDFIARVKEWLRVEPDHVAVFPNEVLAELNAKHAIVMAGGKCVIMNESWDPVFERNTITLSSTGDLRLRYANRFVPQGKKIRPIADAWITHPDRSQYESIVFVPGKDTPGHFNLWRKFGVDPKPGKCGLYLVHLRENIAQGNQSVYDYILNWMAYGVQCLSQRPEVAIVLRGKQGVGKGVMAIFYGQLYGQHFVHVQHARHLIGNFNAHLKDALFVYADESFWAGDKAAEGVLKAMVTEKVRPIEHKGKDVFYVKNYIRLVISSNHDWVVPAGLEERRFFIVDVGEGHLQDTRYFSAIDEEMNTGGREALLHLLLNRDLSGVDLRKFPQTEALAEHKLLSAPDTTKFWHEKLMTGLLPWAFGAPECNIVPCQHLHDDYVQFAKKAGMNRRATETELGMALKKLVPGLNKSRPKLESKQVSSLPLDKDGRAPVWTFPSLKECREEFDRLTRYSHPWPAEIESPIWMAVQTSFDREEF